MNKSLNILLLTFICFCANAQTDSVYTGETPVKRKENLKKEKKHSDFKDKLFYGGNLNVLFGSSTIVNLNPTIGYKVTDRFQVGAGLMFTYYYSRYYGQSISAMFYGPHTFARYFITNDVYLQAQYDKLYQPVINHTTGSLEKGWRDYYLVGGGYRSKVGPKTYLVASIMYNINYDANQVSAYFNPFIQFGIITGF